MNIAVIAHDSKKELMVQFCIAYCGILSRHNLCATGTTGKLVSEATGLEIQRFLSGSHGGDQQISSRIAWLEPMISSKEYFAVSPCLTRLWRIFVSASMICSV